MKRAVRIAGLALIAGLVLALIFHGRLLTAMGSYLDQSSPPQRADIVFVLGGDFAGNRILKAAELVRQGYAPKALVSGPGSVYDSNEADLAISLAQHAGYPASYFLKFPNSAHSTREEAQQATLRLRELGARRVLLVTNSYHSRRAGRVFRQQAPDILFNTVDAPDEYFTVDGWWRNREGRKIFLIEWLKTMAYWVRM